MSTSATRHSLYCFVTAFCRCSTNFHKLYVINIDRLYSLSIVIRVVLRFHVIQAEVFILFKRPFIMFHRHLWIILRSVHILNSNYTEILCDSVNKLTQ